MKKAFTLVEILVVIAIIGVMVALLVPAVQSARESARRTQCTSQLGQLAKAVASFESAKQKLPTFQSALFPTNPPATQRWASWAVQLMPYMDQRGIWDTWSDPTKTPVTQFVPLLTCPSMGRPDVGQPVLHYVCNAGFYPRSGIDTAFTSAPFTYQTLQRRSNTAFVDLANFNALPPAAKSPILQAPSLTHFKDGQGNTALFSESLTAAGWPTVISPFTVGAGGPANSTMMVWLYVTEPNRPVYPSPYLSVPHPNPITKSPINVGPVESWEKINGKGVPAHPAELWHPSSRHPNGVIMSFADGSTRFISDEIPYYIYQSLLTPHNDGSDMPERGFVFSGGELE